MIVVVMGVSGSGKSTIGPLLAQALGGEFAEGDRFHPPANVAKMKGGTPLNDADRMPWLQAMADAIRDWHKAGKTVVLGCSALKHSYRKILRGAAPGVRFVWLKGEQALIAERLAARKGHFMPPALLQSQFAALEPPREAIVADISASPEAIAAAVLAQLGKPGDAHERKHAAN